MGPDWGGVCGRTEEAALCVGPTEEYPDGHPADDPVGDVRVPVCLPCWRQRRSMIADPPREPGWPEERCSICGRRTNYGIYVEPDAD